MLLRGTLICTVKEVVLGPISCRAPHFVTVNDGLFASGVGCTRMQSSTAEEYGVLTFEHTLVFQNVDGASADFEFIVRCSASPSAQSIQSSIAEFVDGELHEKRFDLGHQGCCRSLLVAFSFRPIEIQTDSYKKIRRDAYGFDVPSEDTAEIDISQRHVQFDSKTEINLLEDMKAKLENDNSCGDTWRKGVSSLHRSEAWLVFSGTKSKLLRGRAEYTTISTTSIMTRPPFFEEIDADIHRTFGSHPVFGTKSGQNVLRRVLVKYSLRNPILGYCQGLNFISALLLCVLDEEEVFWMLSTICEELCVNYYSKSMLGAQADVRVLDELIAVRMPKLKQHFDKYGVDLCLITASWFICLFADILPTETTYRVWDILFIEGTPKNVILFRFALALFKIHENALLQMKSFEKIVQGLRSIARTTYDSSLLAHTAFSDIGPISRSVTEQRRAHHTMAISDKAIHTLSPLGIQETTNSSGKMNALRARLAERVTEVKENFQDGKKKLPIGTSAVRKFSESVEGMKGIYFEVREKYKGSFLAADSAAAPSEASSRSSSQTERTLINFDDEEAVVVNSPAEDIAAAQSNLSLIDAWIPVSKSAFSGPLLNSGLTAEHSKTSLEDLFPVIVQPTPLNLMDSDFEIDKNDTDWLSPSSTSSLQLKKEPSFLME